MSDELYTPFSVQQSNGDGAVTLALTGELDLATAPQLRDLLGQLALAHRTVIVDLRGLLFIDSSGLAVLIRAAAHSRQDGWALRIIRGGSREVERAISLVGLDDVLPFAPP